MADPVKVGTYARKGDLYKQWNGEAWIDVPPPASETPAPRKMSAQEQATLNNMAHFAQTARSTAATATKGAQIAKRLKTGQLRGSILEAAIREPSVPGASTGFFDDTFDKIGAAVVGPLARRLTGYISDKDVQDYQDLQRMRMTQTQSGLQEQKGVQARDDAIRELLKGLSATNVVGSNVGVANEAQVKAREYEAVSNFMTKFANKYGGLNAVDEKGRGWQKAYADSTGRKLDAPVIKRIK